MLSYAPSSNEYRLVLKYPTFIHLQYFIQLLIQKKLNISKQA